MTKLKVKPFLALFLTLFLFSFACTQEQEKAPAGLYSEMFPVANPKADVCILYYGTEFKMTLKNDLVKALNEKQMSVVVDSISNTAPYEPAKFDVVIILSSIQAFGPLPQVAAYIKRHAYAKNIVYFSGYAKFDFPYSYALDKKKIDAITSATVPCETKAVEEVQNRILAKVMRILGEKNK